MIEGFVPWEALPETGAVLDPPCARWWRRSTPCPGRTPSSPAPGTPRSRTPGRGAGARPTWTSWWQTRRAGGPSCAGCAGRPRRAGGRAAGAPWGPRPWRPWGRVAGGGRLARPPSALAAGGPARGARPGWPVPGGAGVAAAPAGLPDRRAGRGARWRYRRLVLEPVPYHLEPARCRVVLDAALDAARQALQPERERCGWAERARPRRAPRRACPVGRLRRWGRGRGPCAR